MLGQKLYNYKFETISGLKLNINGILTHSYVVKIPLLNIHEVIFFRENANSPLENTPLPPNMLTLLEVEKQPPLF